MSSSPFVINIDPQTEESRVLWAKALKLARILGEADDWTLIGGLMVQLHAIEHDLSSRLTADIDTLADSRRRPSATRRVAQILERNGAAMSAPSRMSKEQI